MHILTLRGAYVYKPEGGQEVRIGPGSYLHVPGGTRHWSGASDEETIFLDAGDHAFDLNWIEKPPEKK